MALKFFTFSCLVILIILFYVVNFQFKTKCSTGQFRLYNGCYSYLDCNDVKQMNPIRILARGTVKNVWLVEWNHQPLVMSTLTMTEYKEDFQANVENLLRFRMNKNPFIIELIGNCGQSIFTPYYPLGDMNNLRRILAIRKSNFNNRLLYCIEYVKILQFLHQNSMVMCDSNDLTKTLSQYLITDNDDDDDRLIIMNDLDALPNTNHGPIKCGHRPIVGDFVAPEQRYPNTYDDGYDHKTDIWKVPDVCHWIIKDDVDDDDQLRKLKITLFQQRLLDWIHQKCKSPKSIERPEAMEIVKFYKFILSLSK